MLISDEMLHEISKWRKEAPEIFERRLLEAYKNFKDSKNYAELAYIILELAYWKTSCGLKALNSASEFFAELEQLEPGAESKLILARFYYLTQSYRKLIEVVDGIEKSDEDRGTRYSALALKGQSCIEINLIQDAEQVLDSMIELAKKNPKNLPFGDEVDLLSEVVRSEKLRAKGKELLLIATPRIREEEFRLRAEALVTKYENT
jgi:hypothetical protein